MTSQPEPAKRRGPAATKPRLQQLRPELVALEAARRNLAIARASNAGLEPGYELTPTERGLDEEALLRKTRMYRTIEQLMAFALHGGSLPASPEKAVEPIFPAVLSVLERKAESLEQLVEGVDSKYEEDPVALALGAALTRWKIEQEPKGPPIKLGELALLAGVNRSALAYRSRKGDLAVTIQRRPGSTGERIAGDGYVVTRTEARRFLQQNAL
jgi:hypothetical protein